MSERKSKRRPTCIIHRVCGETHKVYRLDKYGKLIQSKNDSSGFETIPAIPKGIHVNEDIASIDNAFKIINIDEISVNLETDNFENYWH